MTFINWFNAAISGKLTEEELIIALLINPFVFIYFKIVMQEPLQGII